MPNTISATAPSWTTSPLMSVRTVDSRTSTPRTIPGPTGQNPSMPFTRVIPPASVSRKSWSPTSLAGAKPAMWSHTSAMATFFIVRPTIAAISPS